MFVKLKNRNNSCTGFTLLEVLVASFIGLALIGVILQNYLSAKKIYKVQNEIAHLGEDIRFAGSFLQQNIMQAGFVGCRRISEYDLANHTDFEISDVVHGYDSNSAQALRDLAGKVIPNTDVIVITKAKTESTTITTNIKTGDTSISVKKNLATKSNRFLLISDYNNADLFITKKHTGTIIDIAGNKLNHSYQTNNTKVRQFERIAFFISEVSYPTAKNKHVYSLYFLVNHGEKQELIPEISNMQIGYGVDVHGENKVTEHLKAAEITNRNLWDKVLSVMITLTPQDRLPGLKPWKIYIKLRERG
ncbi:type IV pilus assembly protein PilW [Gammaproteobacteria bacterium]